MLGLFSYKSLFKAKAYNFICLIIETNPFALVAERCSFKPILSINIKSVVAISLAYCPEKTLIKRATIPL